MSSERTNPTSGVLQRMKVSTKLLIGFLLVAVVLLIVGATGSSGTTTMSDKMAAIVEAAPLVKATMEMKIAVARDLQMVMEFLASRGEEVLAAVGLIEGRTQRNDPAALGHGHRRVRQRKRVRRRKLRAEMGRCAREADRGTPEAGADIR